MPVLLFLVGGRRCALPVAGLRGVVMPRPVDGAAGADGGAVLGVVRDGGAVVPVVDLRRWLDASAPPSPAPRPRWIVVQRGPHRVALAVDGVERVAAASASADAPGVERPRVARYLAVAGALCAEPDVDAIVALVAGRGA